MKTFTIQNIREWGACYDPIKYLPEGWTGTAVEILQKKEIPNSDRLWCVLRTDLVSERLMRLFPVWCAREVAKFVTDTERQKFLEILVVVERVANGEATEEERAAARDAARDAAWAAARDAAWAAAWAAARAAARDAAWDAAWDAARAAEQEKQITKLIDMVEKENS